MGQSPTQKKGHLSGNRGEDILNRSLTGSEAVVGISCAALFVMVLDEFPWPTWGSGH